MMTELEPLGLPEVSHKALKFAPLVLTLCQVKFSSMLSLNEPASFAAFQRAVGHKYPITLPVTGREVVFGINTKETEFLTEHRSSQKWQFADQDDNWRIVLSQDFFTLETRKYEHFEDFLDRLKEALDALIKHIQPTVGTRLGLRCINEIRLDNLENMDWLDVVRSELLGPVSLPELVQNTTQVISMQQLLLHYPEDLTINIQHGLFPFGTTVRLRLKEQTPNNAFYLLDFDVFRDFSVQQSLAMNSEVIGSYIETYYKMISRLFQWSVTEEYIKKLES